MLATPIAVKADLKCGMSSVKRIPSEFNGVGSDLALEQTQNRSSAVCGGWTGITKDEISLQKWLLLYPVKSSMHQSLLPFCKINDDPFDNDIYHREGSKSRMHKDNEDVRKIVSGLIFRNIFQCSDGLNDLRNISSGKFTSKEVIRIKKYVFLMVWSLYICFNETNFLHLENLLTNFIIILLNFFLIQM